MKSLTNYELFSTHGKLVLTPSKSPVYSSHRQAEEHTFLNHDHSAETLLGDCITWEDVNVNSASGKEQIATQCSEHQPEESERLHFQDWCWEIFATIFSLACVVAIIVLLRIYQGKSLSSWDFYYDITPNTLVALLSTSSRTALIVPVASCLSQLKWIYVMSSPRPLQEFQILDEASRGPWGSLTLIWRLHLRAKLATWGAIITVLSLTMGPLSQQLLSYPSRIHFEASGATLYRNQVYDSGSMLSPCMSSTESSSSLYRQLLTLNFAAKDMDLRMQGAIFNGLFNLSTPVLVECQTGNCQWDDFTTLAVASECRNATPSITINCDPSPDISRCIWTSSFGLSEYFYIYLNEDGSRELDIHSTHAIETPPISKYSIELNSTLLEFAIATKAAPSSDKPLDIMECNLRWVARQLQNTTVADGIFHPGIATDYELVGVENHFDRSSWVTFSVANESASSFPGNTSFSVLPNDNDQIAALLNNAFSMLMDGTFGGALRDFTNLTQAVQRVSNSMTNTLSQRYSGIKVPGKMMTSEQYVRVNWGWIILPIAEVAMSIALLAATLLQSWRKGVAAWKSSAIVPLLTEMEESWRAGEFGVESAREVEKRIKGMAGVLESKGDGRRIFRRVE